MTLYAQLAEKHVNPCARDLLLIMERKKTNLCVSVDVTTKKELLEIADKTGPYICLLKTHIDIISDYDSTVPEQLTALAQKHSFMIFEDRKFADIGNTVRLQYSSGIYNIASWAHITNAHLVPGEGIISGLKEVGAPLGRGLLLLAEMSSKGTLATGTYTECAVTMAKKHCDFVIGFIAMGRLASLGENDNFIIMTPGIGFGGGGDKLGQQYKDPSDAILGGSDIIIVGRGIYGNGKDVAVEAQKYQEAGWNAYLERARLSLGRVEY